MDQVEIARDTVGGRIHCHWRYDDPVRQNHFAKFKRCEHRPGDFRFAGSLLPERPLRFLKPAAVTQSQIFMADPLRPGQQRVSELPWFEVEISPHRFEPFGRIARAVLELQNLEVPFGLIFGQRLDPV